MEITKGENANLAGMEPRCPKQLGVDISNLRFYSAMAHDFKWQTDVIHWSVISNTLKEIAERLASPAPTPPLDVEAEKRIAEIRERESKATKGPWKVLSASFGEDEEGCNPQAILFEVLMTEPVISAPDGEFLGKSRLDIPFLLEQISLLRRHIASPAQPEKRDEWVSVENEMPKDFLGVIVAHYPFKELVVWVAMRVNGFWVQCHNPEMEFCTHKVTHWQPLPAPPQSGKEGQP